MITQQTQDSMDKLQGRLVSLGITPREMKVSYSGAVVAVLPTQTGGYIELEHHHLYSGEYIIGDSRHQTLRPALTSAGLLAIAV